MAIYYKAFKRDMTCLDFQYEEGKEYKIDGPPVLYEKGFHFCKDLVLTLQYYPIDKCITENKYAEVEVLGETEFEEPTKHKGVTNHILIKRVLTDDEVLALTDGKDNSGDRNSGDRNSGDRNSGDRNSGDWNSGYANSGDWNSGDRNSGYGNSGYGNSGDRNSGDRNSGDWNSGNRNSGDGNSGDGNSGDWNSGYRNSGDRNSGDWNSTNRESGFFNSKLPKKIRVFNKKCLLSEWEEVQKPRFIYFDLDPNLSYKENWQKAFESASKKDIELLRALPNFDSDVFFDITGIRV